MTNVLRDECQACGEYCSDRSDGRTHKRDRICFCSVCVVIWDSCEKRKVGDIDLDQPVVNLGEGLYKLIGLDGFIYAEELFEMCKTVTDSPDLTIIKGDIKMSVNRDDLINHIAHLWSEMDW